MTSKNSQNQDHSTQVEQLVKSSLDSSVNSLSSETKDKLYQARMTALASTEPKSISERCRNSIHQFWSRPWLPVSASLALAVFFAITLNIQTNNNRIPAIPASLIAGDVPTENIAMLEDLDFAIWLAENEADHI